MHLCVLKHTGDGKTGYSESQGGIQYHDTV